jgi:allantoin racemase
MSDSGVTALRSRLSIPVVGAGQASYLAACLLGHRFSIITMWDQWHWFSRKVITEQGLQDRLASIRSIGVRPDAESLLTGKEEEVFPLLAKAAELAIEEDGADVLILGSTTMHQSHQYLAERLGVPVVNPGLVAYRTCETLLSLGLSHSKASYSSPEVLNDDILRQAARQADGSGGALRR